MQLVLPTAPEGIRHRFRLPRVVPQFNTRAHRLFSIVWIAAFLLAIVGPAIGLYDRYREPQNNSQLLFGSRAGFAVSPADATRIRFLVDPATKATGIRAGDQIIAIYGLRLPNHMPVTEEALAQHANDPAYIAMGNLLFGTDNSQVPLTLRGSDGRVRDVSVTTGEQHIDAGARAIGISPKALSFIDLLPVLAYPFLLWAAWLLHRRNARDVVSSIFSLAILLGIAAEQPSSVFLATAGVPRWLNVALYDVGNVLLLAGIMLFPHGSLSFRRVLLIAFLPVLMFLHGQAYQSFFVCFIIIGVLNFLRVLRATRSSEQRQQIRWALLGISAYAFLRCLSIACDYLKWSTGSFGHQLLVELAAGICFAVAVLMLQLGLLIALLKYRLYDAEAIISRTINVALVALIIAALFGSVAEGVIKQMEEIYPGSETAAAMIGAVLAIMFIEPLRKTVEQWTERHFHKNLLELKHGLPETLRDLREVACFDDFINEVLTRVAKGVQAHRVAFVIGRDVKHQVGITCGEVLRWLAAFEPPQDDEGLSCKLDDRIFPVRVRIHDGGGFLVGWLLIGPRPDGTIAGKDEREALEHIIVPLARSLRIVLNREQERQEMLDLIEAHRQRLERIEMAFGV